MVENVEMEAREPIKDDRLPGPSSNTRVSWRRGRSFERYQRSEDPHATVTDFTYADGKGLL